MVDRRESFKKVGQYPVTPGLKSIVKFYCLKPNKHKPLLSKTPKSLTIKTPLLIKPREILTTKHEKVWGILDFETECLLFLLLF